MSRMWGKTIPIQEKGELVCGQCGLVINERILDISNSGKRAFTKQEKERRERTGSPISILLPDMGLSTVIDKNSIKNPDLKRAAKWNSRMTWDKRNMLIATTELKRIGSNLNLPDHVKKAAIRLYINAFKKNYFEADLLMVWLLLVYILRVGIKKFLEHFKKFLMRLP